MTSFTCRFVTLAVASVAVPAGHDEMSPATTHLAAVGVLIAERNRDFAWRFTLHTAAIGAGEREDELLAWAADTLPERGIVIGWQLADAIVAPLLAAGADGDSVIARAFLDRFTRLATAPSVDLAIPHGGAGAPALDEVAKRIGIDATIMGEQDVESAWAFGNVAWLRQHVGAQAITAWQLWLAEANGGGATAAAAFENWLAG